METCQLRIILNSKLNKQNKKKGVSVKLASCNIGRVDKLKREEAKLIKNEAEAVLSAGPHLFLFIGHVPVAIVFSI